MARPRETHKSDAEELRDAHRCTRQVHVARKHTVDGAVRLDLGQPSVVQERCEEGRRAYVAECESVLGEEPVQCADLVYET